MLSRHRICCYIVFAERVTLTLVRVTYFTHFPIYNLSIYLLFLSVICIGLHSVMDILVDFEPMYPGFESRELHDFFIYFFMLFLVIFITEQFANSTHDLLSVSYFITPYDAQASSAFSALIKLWSGGKIASETIKGK